MIEERPAPLTPADCDLSSMKWFPLHHKRLLKSSWWKRASRDARAISVVFWAVAYDETPAASLPNDDFELAGYAGFGENVEGWLAFKDAVMSAWVLCSDGRWYHPTLAEFANATWESGEDRRRREREKKRRQRAKPDDGGHDGTSPGENPEVPPGTGPNVPGGQEVHIERRGEEITGEDTPVDSVGADKPEAAPSALATIGKKPRKAVATRGEDPPADKRGTRIAWDWVADAKDRAFAEEIGYSRREILALEDAFLDHWKAAAGAKGVKLDWRATWRTWVRFDIKFNGGPHNGNGSNASNRRPSADRGKAQHQERVGDMLAGAMGALDELRGRNGGG